MRGLWLIACAFCFTTCNGRVAEDLRAKDAQSGSGGAGAGTIDASDDGAKPIPGTGGIESGGSAGAFSLGGSCGGPPYAGGGGGATAIIDASTPPDAVVYLPDSGWVPPSFPDGGPCALPAGDIAPGCPMVLAPICPNPLGTMSPASSCDLPIDSLWSKPELLKYIDVYFGIEWPVQGGRLLRVADAQACASTGNGWYVDDAQNPTIAHVCPSACACAEQLQTGGFGLMYGCEANAAPGLLDSTIPCPRCAQTRPPSCGSQTGAFTRFLVQCEFPLEFGFSPSTTNVKYVQNKMQGLELPNDGYLTFVSSLADCDKVDEGWTLDFTTEPATVQICPSACSCAIVNNAALSLESGCPRNEYP